MKCKCCDKEMTVINVELSEDKTKCRQEFGCVNSHCAACIGNDLNNPSGTTCKSDWIYI